MVDSTEQAHGVAHADVGLPARPNPRGDFRGMPTVMEGLRSQVHATWQKETRPFALLIEDYQQCLRSAQEAQACNGGS